MAKWIEFMHIPQAGKMKTKVFAVINKATRDNIGQIRWYAPFRKYSFMPYPNTVYEQDCLRDIMDFIRELEYERKGQATPRVRLSEYGNRMQPGKRKWMGRLVDKHGDSVKVRWDGHKEDWMHESQIETI